MEDGERSCATEAKVTQRRISAGGIRIRSIGTEQEDLNINHRNGI